MAEINIGGLGGSGGGGTSTWLKPEMESPANVEITSNQYLRFYKDPATGAYLEVNMSGANPTFRTIDTDGNIMTLDPDSLDFNSSSDPTNPAQANYLPTEVRIKTGTGGDEAALYFICLDTNPNVNAHLDLVRGTWNTDFGSSDPVLDGMQIGELSFWGQVTTGLVLPGSTSNINRTARITVYATENYSAGARGSEMVLVTTQAGGTTQKENFRLLGTGQNQMTEYGLGDFTGTLTFLLGVTIDGEIIELDPDTYGTWLKPQLEAGNDVEIEQPGDFSLSETEPDAYSVLNIAPYTVGMEARNFESSVNSVPTLFIEYYSDPASTELIPQIGFERYGLSDIDTPIPLASGMVIGQFKLGLGALIQGVSTELQDDVYGTKIEFYTTDNATATNDLRVTIDQSGNVGINVPTPTSSLHISGSGFAQCRLENDYTPTGTADANGATGDLAWDDDFFYVKTSAGWKRTALSTF